MSLYVYSFLSVFVMANSWVYCFLLLSETGRSNESNWLIRYVMFAENETPAVLLLHSHCCFLLLL